MNIVFFGNTKYSLIVAQKLYQEFGLSLVVTTADKPRGRLKKLTPTLTKDFAKKNNIPIKTYDTLTDKSAEEIAEFQPDFLAVCDYGLILPKEILALPKYAALNVHHSLLPKYRGPSPVQGAILAGEKISGVTIIQMDEDVDAGNILAQKKYPLKANETSDSLLIALNQLGANLLAEVIQSYLKSTQKPRKQNEKEATYTHRYSKEDGQIDIDKPPDPIILDRMIRALYPWPGVWTELKWKVESARPAKPRRSWGKWKVLKIKLFPSADPFLIQPEGKRPMTLAEFKNGYPNAYNQISNLLKLKAQS